MCLIVFSYKAIKNYDLIIAANRDEFYHRRTKPAAYWEEDRRIWGGRDLESGGSWMGVRSDGRFAFLTNYRNLYLPSLSQTESRGLLIRDFLLGDQSPQQFQKEKESGSQNFEGFNLIFGDRSSAYYWNPKKYLFQELAPGIYGLSNGVLDEPWFKVTQAKQFFQAELDKGMFQNPEPFFGFLQDRTQAQDSELPDTGMGMDREKMLSSIFIELPGYGTRSSTYVALPEVDSPSSVEKGDLILKEQVWIS